MKLDDLVKTYKFINDPRIPKVNMKFLAVFVMAVAVVAGLAFLTPGANDESSLPPAASTGSGNHIIERPGAGTTTTLSVYIGYDPQSFDPSAPYSRAEVDKAVATWKAANPGLVETQRSPVTAENIVIGFEITYLAPPAADPTAAAESQGSQETTVGVKVDIPVPGINA
ncbi:MAG: hypothetical protein HY556_02190 [Euryarchaeota archaeon]|nr:hypothetical protein [Euryarchaeota archaeon]